MTVFLNLSGRDYKKNWYGLEKCLSRRNVAIYRCPLLSDQMLSDIPLVEGVMFSTKFTLLMTVGVR